MTLRLSFGPARGRESQVASCSAAAIDPFENAALDPWSGNSSGEVEKSEGFDAF